MRADFFQRLPPAMALLVLSTFCGDASAYALPQPTQTLPYHVLDVVAWPPLPTAPAISNAEFHDFLLRRQESQTICGYINGDPNLAATCGAGSHCVLDQKHNAVGCCPNGEAQCTTGVYTGCIDYNSGPQTVVDPYVYTCQGGDVCYKNQFGGGASQYGCGTASSLAATVDATASGITAAVSMSSLDLTLTAQPTTVPTPITINPSTGTRSLTSSSAASSSTTSTSTSSITSSSPTSTSASPSTSNSPSETSAAPAAAASSVDRTGAIVGGTISGVAVLVALIAVAIFLMRRRKANMRQGPGGGVGGQTQYISPMSGDQGFQRLHDSNVAYETGLPPGTMAAAAAVPAGGVAAAGAQPHEQWQQQQQQQWATDNNPQVGYMDNTGTVRYVENNTTVPQSGYVDVVSPEVARSGFGDTQTMMATPSMPVSAQYSAHPAFQPASTAPAAYMGNTTEITSPAHEGSISQTPMHGYHYPGQFPAAYASGTVPAALAAHKRSSSQGAVSSYYNSAAAVPSSIPEAPVSMRGGGGGSMRSSHPIAAQFTYESWSMQNRPNNQPEQPAPAHQQSSTNPGFDEYLQGYDSLECIGEEESLNTSANQQHSTSPPDGSKPALLPRDTVMSRSSRGSSISSSGGRPLWHQNRRQPNRNQLWM